MTGAIEGLHYILVYSRGDMAPFYVRLSALKNLRGLLPAPPAGFLFRFLPGGFAQLDAHCILSTVEPCTDSLQAQCSKHSAESGALFC